MYRHVAKFRLDLAQLWRRPVSWCTVWKGTPQDCMDHVRGRMTFLVPWTVRCQVWSDSLKQNHSGISTDVLLFSDINLSLVHHYRVHKRGVPHVAFRKNYMAWLRALLPSPVAQSQDSMLSPVSTGPISLRHACSAELELESPRRTRHARRRVRPVRVMGESVGDLPILTIQDPSDVQDAIVYDCQPPLLPVSLQLKDIGPLPLRGATPWSTVTGEVAGVGSSSSKSVPGSISNPQLRANQAKSESPTSPHH